MDQFAQMLMFGLLKSGLYALTSAGLALSLGVVGIVNFAHGEFVMLGAYIGYWLFVSQLKLDPFLALPVGALLLFALGAATYQGAIRPVLQAPELNQMLLTFGISILLQTLALILWSGELRTINAPEKLQLVELGPFGSPSVARLGVFGVAALVVGALFLLLERTRTGKAMRAVAQSRLAASLVGIEVNRTYLLAVGFSAAMAGMAGVMLNLVLYTTPLVGLVFILKAFSIVVLAGLGNLYGVVWASLLLGVAEQAVQTYVPNGAALADGLFFIIIFAVLLWRPQGLVR